MEPNLLDKNRGIVLYRQLATVLRQHFIESKLTVGSRIPTEFELSKTFGVSRGTVRQALGLLEKEGLIDRVRPRAPF
jgi:GntR family transcriptional regulator